MDNLIKDLSKLTTIPYATLNKLKNVEEYCIGHAVYEAIQKNEQIVNVDIGLGQLMIKVSSEDIRYKFIPSSQLENTIRNTVSNKESPLVIKVEEKLKDKVMNVYKELL